MMMMNTDNAFTDIYLTLERDGKSFMNNRESKTIILTIPFQINTISDCVKKVYPFIVNYMSEYRRLYIDSITKIRNEKPWKFLFAKTPLKDGNTVKFYTLDIPYYVVEEYRRMVDEAGSKEYLVEKFNEFSNNWDVCMTTDDKYDCLMYFNNCNFRVLRRGCLLCRHIVNNVSYIEYTIVNP